MKNEELLKRRREAINKLKKLEDECMKRKLIQRRACFPTRSIRNGRIDPGRRPRAGSLIGHDRP